MSRKTFLSKYRPVIARSKVLLLVCFCSVFFSTFLQAQSRNDLEKKRKEKEKEIAYTRELINKTKQEHRQTINYLGVLNKQIQNRQELIGTINSEIRLLDKNISDIDAVIEALERDLQTLREEYARMVYFAYKNRNAYQELVFIFSANTFNEAYQRLRFLQFYSEFRKNQIELIRKTQETLAHRIEDLKEKRASKQQLLAQEQEEKQELESDKSSKSRVIQTLKSQESKLRRELREKQQAASRLDAAIKEIIRKEIEEANKAKAAGKSSYALTPEALKLSADFASNKSKLPWPVERGVITQGFGRQAHPTISGTEINNNGVNIQTKKGALARAVFDGEVLRIIRIPGAGNAVMIRHGEYYTIYQNLDQVLVQPGDKVSTKDPIGVIDHNPTSGVTELHFEVWKSFDKMDPQLWLYKN